MEEKEIKYYKRSNGELVDISTMETTHLLNSLNKDFRTLFESRNKNEYEERMNEINNLKEEVYKRFNKFREELVD